MRAEIPLSWQKSSYSSAGNNCVELASGLTHGEVHLCESDDAGTVITSTRGRLRALLALARSERLKL